jgi:hypothetical protein
LNHDMLLREADEMIDETLPHELAHIVCYMKPELGRNHDSGWQRVCTSLGGNGNRTHSMEAVAGHGRTYEYITDRGHPVRLNERRHAAVQAGRSLSYRRGLGVVTNACAHSIVGMDGRTLAAPVVIKAAGAVVPVVQPAFTALPPATPVVRLPVQVLVPAVRPLVTHVVVPGQSKAATSRAIMQAGYRRGDSYETIIAAMIAANGYDRQLARGTFKANAPRVGIPSTFC